MNHRAFGHLLCLFLLGIQLKARLDRPDRRRKLTGVFPKGTVPRVRGRVEDVDASVQRVRR